MDKAMQIRQRTFRIAAALLIVLLQSSPAAADDSIPLSLPGGMTPLGKFDQQGGESLYRAICQGCHMPDAHGAQGAGAYPALAANTRLASAAYPAARVLAGRGAMPAFAASLSDQQVADVVNYVRTHFDNRYADSLAPDDVARLRASMSSSAGSPSGPAH